MRKEQGFVGVFTTARSRVGRIITAVVASGLLLLLGYGFLATRAAAP